VRIGLQFISVQVWGACEPRTPARMDCEELQGFDDAAASRAQVFRFRAVAGQAGDQADTAKVLKGFGGAGVLEVVENDAGGTYRAVYTVKFAEAVFVLHCFEKKSKSGIATPKADMAIIRSRLKVAEALAQEMRNEKTDR
jgi:phage-related protein